MERSIKTSPDYRYEHVHTVVSGVCRAESCRRLPLAIGGSLTIFHIDWMITSAILIFGQVMATTYFYRKLTIEKAQLM